MKRLLLILGIVLATEALADGPVNLPNLRQNATGTSLGGGKYALDVSLPPGAVTVSGGANTGAVFGAADPGLLILGVRHDATGALTGVADGDVSPVQFDSNGNLKVIGSEVATAADGAGALPGLLKIMGGWDGSNVHVALMDSSGRFHVVSRMVDGAGTALTSTLNGGKQSLDVNVSASALPSGAATESTLSTLNGKIAALGQAAMAASHPVVIASDQSAIPVSGTVTANNSSVSATGAAVPASATYIGAIQGGNLTGITKTANGVEVDVKASVLPTGASTEATLSALEGKVPSNLTVTATRLLVDGSGVTQPISAAALPLPSGAATEATLSAASAKLPAALGQTNMAGSMSVTVASNQSAIPTDPSTIKATAAAAIPSTGAFILGSDGTNARPIKTNSSGELVVGVTTSTPSTSTMVLDTVDAVTADANTAPANCRGFQIFADADNTADIRIRYGATDPTASVGIQLEPGRSIDYVTACPSIRVISESGTQAYQIAWFTD